MSDNHTVKWHDSGREPQCAPNPEYPAGKDVELPPDMYTRGSCVVALPYPAKRIGHYIITCHICGACIACTTAGRPDDPRSMKIPCQLEGAA